MKTIIIPTDFSENSLKAIDFVFDFFNEKENQVTICHVYDIPHGGTSGLFTLMELMREQAEKNMKELETLLEDRHDNFLPKIDTKVLQGNFEEQLNAFSLNSGCDFVVMGTKGSSGVQEVLFGSNASKFLKLSAVPIFAIPDDYTKTGIEKVTLSYDAKKLDRNDLRLVKELAIKDQFKIEVLHVRSEGESPIQNRKEVEEAIGKEASLNEVYASNYEEGLKIGLGEGKTLLVLIKRKKSFWASLFTSSNSQKAVKHFKLPILIIPEQ